MSLFSQLNFRYAVHDPKDLPPDEGIEVAFAGRSNAGKSTAINVLSNRKKLAFVSKTPGRTQALNFFEMGPRQFLVDLPGYGYAAVPEKEQQRWDGLISTYIKDRNSLILLVIIADARHGLTALDQYLLDWMAPSKKPVLVLMSKADKLTRQQGLQQLRSVEKQLSTYPAESSAILFSALNKTGVREAQGAITRFVTGTKKPPVKGE